MPFKKGETPPGAKLFVKGKSGNPNGQPRKLATMLKIVGYTKVEAANTINAMLAMNILELKEMYENPAATILEKTIAAALRRSLEKGSLYSIDTLLNRTHGKSTDMIQIESDNLTEIKITYDNRD